MTRPYYGDLDGVGHVPVFCLSNPGITGVHSPRRTFQLLYTTLNFSKITLIKSRSGRRDRQSRRGPRGRTRTARAVRTSYRRRRGATRRNGRGGGFGARLELERRVAVLVRQVLQQRVFAQRGLRLRGLPAGRAGPGAATHAGALLDPQVIEAPVAEAVAAGQRGGPVQQLSADNAAQVLLAQPHRDCTV